MIAILGHTIFYMARALMACYTVDATTSSSSFFLRSSLTRAPTANKWPRNATREVAWKSTIDQDCAKQRNNYQDVETGPRLFLLERIWLNINKKIGGKPPPTFEAHPKRSPKAWATKLSFGGLCHHFGLPYPKLLWQAKRIVLVTSTKDPHRSRAGPLSTKPSTGVADKGGELLVEGQACHQSQHLWCLCWSEWVLPWKNIYQRDHASQDKIREDHQGDSLRENF